MNTKSNHRRQPPHHRNSTVMKKPSFIIKLISCLKKETRRRSASTGNDRSSPLPEDIVVEILVKLPDKTLLRFKCLSTGIRNLIQSSHFVAARADHRRKNGTNGIFLLAQRDVVSTRINDSSTSSRGVYSFSLPFLKNPNLEHLEYVGSWNGLVCLNIFEDANRSSLINMVLWNPVTSEFGFAPPFLPSMIHSHGKVFYGFGYDPVSDDYKSIRLFVCGMMGVLVQVLSWGKRSWAKLEVEPKIGCLDSRIFGILPDGTLTSKGRVNWMLDDGRYTSGLLLSFKLGEEKFEWIYPPRNVWDDDCCTKACVWKGLLAMLVEGSSGTTHSLWLFNDVVDDDDRDRSCRWSKRFIIQTNYPCEWVSEPEDIWRNDEKWNSFLVYQFDDRLALASMVGKLRSRFGYHIQRGFEFTETLVPIPGSSLVG